MGALNLIQDHPRSLVVSKKNTRRTNKEERTKGRKGNQIFEGLFWVNSLHTCKKVEQNYVVERPNCSHYKKPSFGVTSV